MTGRLNTVPGPVESFPTRTEPIRTFRRERVDLTHQNRPRSYLVNAGRSDGISDPGPPDPYARPGDSVDPSTTPATAGDCGCG